MSVRLSHIDFNLLRALDVLLRERSVTRAAELSNVTQRAMSGSLKRLREHFEDELLQRIGLQLELTPLGVALLEPVREAMLQIETAFLTTPRLDPATSRRRRERIIYFVHRLWRLPRSVKVGPCTCDLV